MALRTHNVKEIEDVSRVIGATKRDLQLLDMARDFNEYLKLDSEQLIFALLKKGMKPDISSIFTLSEKNIRRKVEKAVEQNIIPDNLDIDFQIYLLNYRINSYIASCIDIFSDINDSTIAGLSIQEKSVISKKMVEYAYDDKQIDESFFDYLYSGSSPLVNAASKEKLKRFFDYRDLCYGNNLFIKTFISSSSLQHLDKLLKLDKDAIFQRITDAMLNDENLPDDIAQEESKARAKEKFADHIFQQIEKKYSTRSLFLKLLEYNGTTIDTFDIADKPVNMFNVFRNKLVDDQSDASNISSKLLLDTTITVKENGKTIQRTFDIEKDVIRDYINKLGGDTFITSTLSETNFSKDDFIRIFSGIQRVYFLAKENKFDVIVALLKNNYKSAYDVVKSGRSRMLKTLITDLPLYQTRNYIYNAAETKVNKALALLSKYSQSTNSLMSSVVRSKSVRKDDDSSQISVLKMPELETLFGSQDVTDTKHGDSVFGPAAYLVDLLNLLKQIEVTGSNTLYDQLVNRRPDVAKIPLDCQNAISLVPYIDLVIEILEQWIAEKENLGNDFWEWKTKNDEETLKADPDYCAYPVYDKLVENYGWNQAPFDFKNEELKIYSQAMNVDRSYWASLIDSDSNLDPYYDVLGFNSIDKNFFDVNLSNPNAFASKILSSVQYVTETEGVGHFPRIYITEILNNTGFSLVEFEKILDSYFVNPITNNARFEIHYTKKIELKYAFLEIADVDRVKSFIYTMYQYMRLQKATSWSNHLLDAVLLSVNSALDADNSDISKGVNFEIKDVHVRNVGEVKKIQNDLKLSDNQIAAIFGKVCNFEYKDGQSYINWLFVDNDFPQKHKDEFTKLMNGGEISEYENESIYQGDGSLHPFMQYVCSILQFELEDVNDLEFLIPNNQINRTAVVNLFRYNYLLSIFNLSINDLHAYLKLSDTNTLSFDILVKAFNELNVIKSSKFGFEHALYLLKGNILTESSVSVPSDEDFSSTARKLFSLVQTNNVSEEPKPANVINGKFMEEISRLESFDKSLIETIADNSIQGGDFANYINELVGSGSIKITIQQYDAILNYFDDYFKKSETVSLTDEEKAKVNAELIESVFNEDIENEILQAKKAITEPAPLKAEIDAIKAAKKALVDEIIAAKLADSISIYLDEKAGISVQKDGYTIAEKLAEIQKAILFCKKAGLTKENLHDYFTVDNKLPVNIYSLQGTDFNSFLSLLWILKNSEHLNTPSEVFTLYETIIDNTSSESDIIKLHKWSRFFKKSDGTMNGHSTSKIEFPADNLKKLELLVELGFMAEAGVDPKIVVQCLMWNNSAETLITEEIISEFKVHAKEALGKRNYLKRVTELRDVLRVKQRDALVNYMLAKTTLEDSTDLFSYLLIDSQMTPAVSTSRIVQSTLAIQLLIQRIQFNLEPEIELSKGDENRWKWMSLYRVWEANRKIFVYPENWLEPELRDDKSPFFKELEKELSSNEISKDSVEQAYHTYLKKVEKVANIEYCQMFNEEIDNYSVLHVIGRSPGAPHEYFYRKFVNESYWTAWEPLGFEINSEHIAPVVINDRLIVFWLEYSQEAEEPDNDALSIDTGDEEVAPEPPAKVLSIQICWSEFKNGKWTEKRMHKDKLNIKSDDNNNSLVNKKDIRFVFDIAEKNHMYVFFDYNDNNENNNYAKSKYNEPEGFKFAVEIFNNVELKADPKNGNGDKFDNIVIPDGMENYYQKVLDRDGNVSMNIATLGGKPAMKEFLDCTSDNVSVVYPHQYLNFQTQAPFIVEKGSQSLIFVPIIQPKKENEPIRQIRQVVYKLENKFDDTLIKETPKKVFEYYTDNDEKKIISNDKLFDVENHKVIYRELPRLKAKLSAHLGYHPYVGIMRRNVERYGIEGLLDPAGFNTREENLQLLMARQSNEAPLSTFDLNKNVVVNSEINEKFEFNTKSALGIYNWEIFYHIPFMVANHFFTEGNYDEALKWMHFIFDPRETEGSEKGQKEFLGRFWKFKPFSEYNDTKGIEDILFDANIDENSTVEDNELDNQIEIWSNDPFKPHNVARLRISAYMKTTVMRYLDILIARGDQSFKVDTMESINESLQYYIIAAQILGKKPEVLETSIMDPKTYENFDSGELGNAIEYIEEPLLKPENAEFLEKFVESNEIEISSKPFSKERNMKNMIQGLYSKLQLSEEVHKLYFGIPKNDKMLRYWEIVGDRLFKIRNSMNLAGIKRTLSLFALPIDPGMLASAAAAGLDIKALVNGQAGPATQYRFNVVLGQALQLCGELKSLSSQLLSAYEKEDSEIISKLRANHEILLSEKVTRIREKGIEEAQVQLEQLAKQKEIIDFRKKFYETRKKRIKKEEKQLDYMDAAMALQVGSQSSLLLSGLLSLIPDFKVGVSGFGGTPSFLTTYGGEKIAKGPEIVSSVMNVLATIANHSASKSGILAGYERRQEEWNFQRDMAEKEYAPLEQQKLSAEIRKKMSEYELENHSLQIEQSKEAYEVLKTKYTNQELYLWMRKEIAVLQRKAYDMTYSLAKQAEKAYDFELNPGGFSKFISPSHFDSKYEGLLAGEKLYQELKEMELAYQQNNKRKYELTKNISLAMLDPKQIVDLRNSGSCEIILPEILFDMDHPGHCNRRIKSVSLTIPCVAGPYTSVSAELTLIENKFKTKSQEIINGQPLITNMATSSAMNDSGLFQLNFNDDRYLPFEGAGVDSRWALALPSKIKQFDYNSINDVILSIQYTAENGGNRLEVEENLVSSINKYLDDNNEKFSLFIDVKAQYPEVFEKLKSENTDIELSQNLLPGFLTNRTVKTNGILRFDDETGSVISSSSQFGDIPISVELNKFPENNVPERLILLVQLDLQVH